MKTSFLVTLTVGLGAAMPAMADYIEKRPKSSPEYKVAAAVAQAGCTIDAMEWRRLILSLGGSEDDSIWHISEMTRAGEADIVDNRFLKLKGVFGC